MISGPKGAKEQVRLWVRRSLRSISLKILKSLHVQYETIGFSAAAAIIESI